MNWLACITFILEPIQAHRDESLAFVRTYRTSITYERVIMITRSTITNWTQLNVGREFTSRHVAHYHCLLASLTHSQPRHYVFSVPQQYQLFCLLCKQPIDMQFAICNFSNSSSCITIRTKEFWNKQTNKRTDIVKNEDRNLTS